MNTNTSGNKAAIFPALQERAVKAAAWLEDNPDVRESHIDDFGGFFVVRGSKLKEKEQSLHEFTFGGNQYTLVTRE